MRTVGRSQAGAMNDHVGVQRKDVLDGAGRDHPCGRPSRDIASITSGLVVAVNEQPNELHFRMVDDRAQTRLAHGAARPLDYTPLHGSLSLPQ